MASLTHTPEETKRLAADFARTLRGGELVLLEGPLGAGKTTFAQGLCVALGVRVPVRSPTFAVMNLYPASSGDIALVVHLDFYRLKNPDEALELGLEEWLDDPRAVVLVEWPDLAEPHLQAEHVAHVRFAAEGHARRISITRDA